MTIDTQAALASGRELVIKNKLPLKILKCDNDEEGLHFAYLSPEKTDLRPLSRDLNRHFKVKIHLEELTAEAAARLLPGYGPCGSRLCWASAACENLWPCKYKETTEASVEAPTVETTEPQDHLTTRPQSGGGESAPEKTGAQTKETKKKKLVRRLVLK